MATNRISDIYSHTLNIQYLLTQIAFKNPETRGDILDIIADIEMLGRITTDKPLAVQLQKLVEVGGQRISKMK